MAKIIIIAGVIVITGLLLAFGFWRSRTPQVPSYCFTGAFLGDNPTTEDIARFSRDYGKKPYFVMIFTDWGKFVEPVRVESVYSEGCMPVITWEPWKAYEKEALDYDALISGAHDEYIAGFAGKLKKLGEPVFLRFAHEMNGNWYPWSGVKIGAEKYIAMYRHAKDIFDAHGAENVQWIFSINAENIPDEANNRFTLYYPGDSYVDYIGIDGYNWGDTQSWSKWMTFREIFQKSYETASGLNGKPVMISEFSSASSGGDKTRWIKEAMSDIKKWTNIKAFVLFNVDKEVDWSFSADSKPGKEFRRQLEDAYFHDKTEG